MTDMGTESKKEWIYLYIELTHFTIHQKKHNIVNQLHSNKKNLLKIKEAKI